MGFQSVRQQVIGVTLTLLILLGCRFFSPTQADCLWKGEAWAWLDENRNGRWDGDERPLEYVQFSVVDALMSYEKIGSATSDLQGLASLEAWLPDCSEVDLQIVAEGPTGYQFATQTRRRVKDRFDEGPFLFGFVKF